MGEERLESALDLMRRLPPSQVEQNLSFVLELVPDLTDELLQTVDQPLKVAICPKTKKEYLLCDYNRDGDSYRSPWSNEYSPSLPDGALPSDKLRRMEEAANDMFSNYRESYYEGGISSVYFWDLEDSGFAACILLKKDTSNNRGVEKGVWDAIHVIQVEELSATRAHYKLTSTVLLSIETKLNNINLSGNMTRQTEGEFPVNNTQTHLVNMGNMVQELENRMRNILDTVYFGRTKEITNSLRTTVSLGERKRMEALAQELNRSVGGQNTN